MPYVVLACRGLIGMVFAVSVISKLRSGPAFHAFASWLGALPLLRAAGPRPLAAVFAATEVAVVAMLALPWTWRAGLLGAAAVLAVFAAGALMIARTGVRAPCLCFGASEAPIGRRHVLRNAALSVAAAIGAAAGGHAASRPAGIAISLGVAAAATLFVVYLDDLAAVLAGPSPAGGSPAQPVRQGG